MSPGLQSRVSLFPKVGGDADRFGHHASVRLLRVALRSSVVATVLAWTSLEGRLARPRPPYICFSDANFADAPFRVLAAPPQDTTVRSTG